MASPTATGKLHGISKSERLCNFSFKNLLFQQGHTFNAYPLKVFWRVMDQNLEDFFFADVVTQLQGNPSLLPQWKQAQNPSFPHRIIPANAFFTHPAKCLFGVSSKVHKKATDRNHLKRLIKEAYRQNKHSLYTFLSTVDKFCLLAIIYTAKPTLPYHELEEKIIVSLQKIQQQINQELNSTSH